MSRALRWLAAGSFLSLGINGVAQAAIGVAKGLPEIAGSGAERSSLGFAIALALIGYEPKARP